MSADDLRRGALFLGAYRIDALLGRGGMGEVWRAYDFQLKRAVAIKVMLPELAAEPGYVERFERETQVVAQFKHRNIGRVYAAGQIPGREPMQLYMVMELIEGKSLLLLLRAAKRLDVVSATYYAIQVLEALQEAHEKNVIHRDIKPENIIVGKDGHVTVVDFGIAKGRDTTRDTSDARRRNPGTVTNRIGTPRYMSPEQIAGKEVDRRSDLYAVGVVLYLMLAGDFPFSGIGDDDEAAVLMAHIHLPPQPLTMLVPDVSEELWTIVNRLLAKDPDVRYQTAEEAAIDLSAFLRGSIDPNDPIARRLAAERRAAAEKAVFERSQSGTPLNEQPSPRPPPVDVRDSATVPLPKELLAPSREAVPPPAPTAPERLPRSLGTPRPPERVDAPLVSLEADLRPEAESGRRPSATSPWARDARAAAAAHAEPSPAPTAPLPAGFPAGGGSRAPSASSSATGRSWANETSPRPRLSPMARDLLIVAVAGSWLGSLAFAALRLRHAAVSASAAPPAVAVTSSATPTLVAPATTEALPAPPPVETSNQGVQPRASGGPLPERPAPSRAAPAQRRPAPPSSAPTAAIRTASPPLSAAPLPVPAAADTVNPHRAFGSEN